MNHTGLYCGKTLQVITYYITTGGQGQWEGAKRGCHVVWRVSEPRLSSRVLQTTCEQHYHCWSWRPVSFTLYKPFSSRHAVWFWVYVDGFACGKFHAIALTLVWNNYAQNTVFWASAHHQVGLKIFLLCDWTGVNPISWSSREKIHSNTIMIIYINK